MIEAVLELPAAVSQETEAPDVEAIKARFAARYPEVLQMAKRHHRFLRHNWREDAVADTVVFAWRYYLNTAKKGGDADALLPNIVRYSAGHVKQGDRVGGAPDKNDVFSQENCVRCLPRHQDDSASAEAHAAMRSRSPDPADEAVSDLDYQQFLKTLKPAERELAESLADGKNMSDVAEQRGISHQAVNLQRKKLAKKWADRGGYSDPLAR